MADLLKDLQNASNEIVKSVQNVAGGAWSFLTQQRWGPSGLKNVTDQGWSFGTNSKLMTDWVGKNPANALTFTTNMVMPTAGLMSGLTGLGGFASSLVGKSGGALGGIGAWFGRHPVVTGISALGAGTFFGSTLLGSGGTQVYMPGSTDNSKDSGGNDLLGGLLGGGIGGLVTFMILFMLMRNMGGMGGGLFGNSSFLGTAPGATPVIVNTQ